MKPQKSKLLLAVLFLLFVQVLHAQTGQPYYTVYNYGNAWQRGAFYTSLLIPLQDTIRKTDSTRAGDIVMQPSTFYVYGYNGSYWQRVGCCVNSVSNTDQTLTISPTDGNVIAGINLGKDNTWTGTNGSRFVNGLYLGQASSTNGKLNFNNAANSNTVSLVSGTVTSTYEIALPTAAPAVSGYAFTATTGGVGSWSQISLANAVTGVLSPANGGTGVANNAASTWTISGNFATTITVSATTGITLPTSGTIYGTQVGSISSSQLAGSLSDETGFTTGAKAVFSISPTITSPVVGTQDPNNNSTTAASTAYVDKYFPTDTTISAAYTLTSRDYMRTIHCTNSSNINLTIPTGLGTAFVCTVIQEGSSSGTITPTASSTTLTFIPTGTTKTKQTGSAITIRSWATANSFTIQGDLQ